MVREGTYAVLKGVYLVVWIIRALKLHIKQSIRMFTIERNVMHLHTPIQMQI